MPRILIPYLCVTIALLHLGGCHSKDENAAARGTFDNRLEWRWFKEKASLDYSTKKHLSDYEVELESVGDLPFYGRINIREKLDRKVIYSLEEGHKAIVFARWNDVLYITNYSPIASGCEVVAVDLNTGRLLWKSQLQGIGPTMHSEYSNLVNIECDEQMIIVTGNEANGRYIEVLDRQSGKTLANMKLAADPNSL